MLVAGNCRLQDSSTHQRYRKTHSDPARPHLYRVVLRHFSQLVQVCRQQASVNSRYPGSCYTGETSGHVCWKPFLSTSCKACAYAARHEQVRFLNLLLTCSFRSCSCRFVLHAKDCLFYLCSYIHVVPRNYTQHKRIVPSNSSKMQIPSQVVVQRNAGHRLFAGATIRRGAQRGGTGASVCCHDAAHAADCRTNARARVLAAACRASTCLSKTPCSCARVLVCFLARGFGFFKYVSSFPSLFKSALVRAGSEIKPKYSELFYLSLCAWCISFSVAIQAAFRLTCCVTASQHIVACEIEQSLLS